MTPDSAPPSPPPALALAETVTPDQINKAATTSPAGGPILRRCENCGTVLAGPYCHQCGQHDFDLHRSFRHVCLEALDTLFNFESRFFRSIITLLFQPGQLTAEFNAGKRATQMPPFRLYIFVSFLFFLVLFLDSKEGDFIRQTGQPHQGLSINGQPVVTFNRTGSASTPAEKPAPTTEAAPASTEKKRLVDQVRSTAEEAQSRATDKLDPKDQPAFLRQLNEQSRRLKEPAYQQRLSESMQAHLPHLLMLCLPFFALYTRVIFRKSGLMYLQHLVLALHFHTFIYLWILCRKGWVGLADLPGWGLGGGLALAFHLWLGLYPLLMLRRLFANSWPVTLLKAFLLWLAYTVTLGLGFMVMAVAALLLA